MIQEKLNNELIAAMRSKLPSGVNLANLLMDILFLGKEAVYRRLRGEVPFTLAEAATISQRLGVSIDKLVGTNQSNYALFNLDIPEYSNPIETYYNLLTDYTNVTKRFAKEPGSELASATNMVPQPYCFKYRNLSKFRLFKWMYQHEQIDFLLNYAEFDLPEKLYTMQQKLVEATQQIHRTTYIWDYRLFDYLTNDIRYFSRLQLISKTDLELLRQELFEFLDELENVAARGRFASGCEANIYISDINFEATYTYISSSGKTISLIRVFSLSSITSENREVYEGVSSWIGSLKKFSTLISQSGEMQRIRFFNRQREIIREL